MLKTPKGKYEFSKHILLVGLDLAPLRLGARGACPFRPPLDPPLVTIKCSYPIQYLVQSSKSLPII